MSISTKHFAGYPPVPTAAYRVMDALNSILGCRRDHSGSGRIFRRGSELRGAAGRAAVTKEEDDGVPTISGLPVRRKIEIDFRSPCGVVLYGRHGLVVDAADIGLDRH